MSDTNQLIEFDIRGQVCPSCLLIALKEIATRKQELKNPHSRLVIMTDNRDATATIPEATRAMGYETAITKQQGYYRIEIGRATAAGAAAV